MSETGPRSRTNKIGPSICWRAQVREFNRSQSGTAGYSLSQDEGCVNSPDSQFSKQTTKLSLEDDCYKPLTSRPVHAAVPKPSWFPSIMSYDLRNPEQRAIAMDRFAAGIKPTMHPAHAARRRRAERAKELTRQRHDTHDQLVQATSAPKSACGESASNGCQERIDFLARLRGPKRQIPQPPALLPSSLPSLSSIPQVFIKYTPYDYTDRQKIREKLYQAALLEPVAAQIVEAGAAKRSRERAEVGPAPHGFEYVQVGESVFLTAIDGNESMMYVGTSDSIFVVHS
ncbi:hypothetical protein DFH08DRAFT_821190 [Mycena albidolilacea]|uniref:Uncharacterized protein n=1 Tax=Mycena albidolilacea TaxID=1033008 RepID=A0AAD6ZBA9_9AGAR|nr:hypothetical protein DFH08DRAFT_827529 [Mycena albidolilacea]KAJ7314862.1 hypothetical protein DFH08DRAFT_821190 [Mycena albidolilacea]